VDTLRRCVGDPASFLTDIWQQRPALLSPAEPPVDVFPPAEMERLLDHGLPMSPYIELVQHNGTVPPERFCRRGAFMDRAETLCPDAALVRRLVLSEGAGILLRYVEHWHPGVRQLTEGLAAALGRNVEAFYFFTPPQVQSRPVHRDDADVLAIQVSGRKEWRVYEGPTSDSWTPKAVEQPACAPLLQVTTGPGDVLYIPRGYAHAAKAVGNVRSVHLSLTIREAGSAELKEALVDALLSDLELPVRPLGDLQLTRTAEQFLEGLRERLEKLDAQSLLEAARARAHGFAG
jgi:ribosomal protein L16 Arg81 hydroxylase